jgi:hypothetical protein
LFSDHPNERLRQIVAARTRLVSRFEQGVLMQEYPKEVVMSTTRQKTAARRNIAKARKVQSARAHGARIPQDSGGITTAEKNDLPASAFAFPKERKEPITDARHVRNAVARFDQVEGVSDAERDRAWKRIRSAAKKFDVDIEADNWRELFKGGKAKKH